MPDEISIAGRIRQIHATLPDGVQLVAVSKFHPVHALQQAYNAGQRIFGESRVAELLQKIPQMPDDVRWHFIGHLQTNKVKQIIGKTSLIESVDSQHLLDLIDKLSAERGIVTNILMQVHVAAEDSKYGWLPDQLIRYFEQRRFESLRATHICGIMGMATNTDDTNRIAADFDAIALTRQRILQAAPDLQHFDTLSMGMSDDYPLAIKHGSNLVRIGTYIFGERQY